MTGNNNKTTVANKDAWDDEVDDSEVVTKPYTKQELVTLLGEQVLRPSKVTVGRLLQLQVVVTVISMLVWSAKGKHFALDSAAISALFGGLAAFVPAALFAARARLLAPKGRLIGGSVLALVTGELLKIVTTVTIFLVVIGLYPEIEWLPLLLTYILAIKCYVLVWFLK